MSVEQVSRSFFMTLLSLISVTQISCVSMKEEFFAQKPERLLTENPLQGWSVLEKAPARVGEYDETYFEAADTTPPTRQDCQLGENQGQTYVICRDKRPTGVNQSPLNKMIPRESLRSI